MIQKYMAARSLALAIKGGNLWRKYWPAQSKSSSNRQRLIRYIGVGERNESIKCHRSWPLGNLTSRHPQTQMLPSKSTERSNMWGTIVQRLTVGGGREPNSSRFSVRRFELIYGPLGGENYANRQYGGNMTGIDLQNEALAQSRSTDQAVILYLSKPSNSSAYSPIRSAYRSPRT